jgi:prepilin-type N-terminal cleavage/methylation domain-containing protein
MAGCTRLAIRSRKSFPTVNATSREDGFSIVELMIVAALIAIGAGMAVPISAGMISRAKADSASLTALGWLETTRNRAIAERRNFEVTFDPETNRVTVERVEPDNENTPIMDLRLEDGLTFMQFDDAPDTPDLFGNGDAVDFDGPAPYMFTSDGSFLDANGDPSNGTLFLGKPDQVETGRAITIFGVTGLMRTWALSGNRWYQ